MEMTFNGEFQVDQKKDKVFALLSDIRQFAPLIPTFHSLEMKDDRSGIVRVKVGMGKIRGTASTELTLEESEAPRRARYVGRGRMMQGAYEFAASFDLEDDGKGTLVKWQGESQLAGKVLSLVGGGMRGYAEKEINRLISSLQSALSPGARAEAKPKAEGWLARFLRGGKPDEAAVESDVETIDAAGLAAFPEEKRQASDAARQRIAGALAVKRRDGHLARKEDDRLIRGQGLFVDDYKQTGMAYLVCVRSPYAHARIKHIDVSKAEALPGVLCTLTGEEIAAQCDPFPQIGAGPSEKIKDYPLAVGKTRHQGEPVAAVVAQSQAIAMDGAQLVDVEYEVLEPVIRVERALEDKTLLHEEMGTNTTFHDVYDYGDVDKAFEKAAHVVKIDKLYFHRFGSTPLEGNACVATWNQRGEIDLLTNTIMSIPLIMLAPCLKVGIDQIRLRTHDIGGAFGNKITNYLYIAQCALASRKLGGAPVKWIETRGEHMQTGGHGSDRTYLDTEVALTEDGEITAIKSRHVDDCGAFPRYEPLGCVIFSQTLPGAYKLKNIRIDFNQVVTNKGPAAPNRGYSRLPQIWFMERVVDICGHQLGIPADEMRLRNYVPEFPYTTPNGCVYDSGDLPGMLAKAKQLIGWDEWKQKQAAAKAEGRLIGIGIGTTLDSGTNNWGQARYVNPGAPFSGNSQAATVKLDLDGTVVVTLGSFPQGQGHETTAAQVVAEELNIPVDLVHVKPGFDSLRGNHTVQSGTYASQFAVTGLGSAHGATVMLKNEMKKLASWALQADEDTLEFGMGQQGPEVRVPGTDKALNFWMLQNFVNYNSAELPDELRSLSLSCRYVYRPPFQVPDVDKKYGNLTLTYALQLHIAVVEVDPRTFQSKILDYAVVDDCGKVVNHMIVEGQVHGGTGHGLGAALLETIAHDDEGNVINGSFTDYAPITISNMPDLKCANMESPSPFTFNGAKGMGEGGGAPLQAVCAALQDALHDRGITIQTSHNSPMAMYDLYAENPPRPVHLEHR